jgi:predicted FMN-binding regulatory protein PaiB
MVGSAHPTKLSQNKSQTDRQNIAESLLKSTDSIERSIGTQMKQNLELEN